MPTAIQAPNGSLAVPTITIRASASRARFPNNMYSATSTLVGIPEVLQFQICLALDLTDLAALALCCSNLRNAAFNNQVWLVIYGRRFRGIARSLRNAHPYMLMHSYFRKIFSQVLRASCKGMELRGAKKRLKSGRASCAVDQVVVVDGSNNSGLLVDQVVAGFRDGMVECYSLLGGKRTAQVYTDELLAARRLAAERTTQRDDLAASHKNTLLRFKLQQSRLRAARRDAASAAGVSGSQVITTGKLSQGARVVRSSGLSVDDGTSDDDVSTDDDDDCNFRNNNDIDVELDSVGREFKLLDINDQFDLWSAGMLDEECEQYVHTKKNNKASKHKHIKQTIDTGTPKKKTARAQHIPIATPIAQQRQVSGAGTVNPNLSVSPIVTHSCTTMGGDLNIGTGHMSDASSRSGPDAMLWVRKANKSTKSSKKQKKKKLQQAQQKIKERASNGASVDASVSVSSIDGPLGEASPPVSISQETSNTMNQPICQLNKTDRTSTKQSPQRKKRQVSTPELSTQNTKTEKLSGLGRCARRRIQRELYDAAVAETMSHNVGVLDEVVDAEPARLDRSASTSSLLSYDWVSSSDSECTGQTSASNGSNVGGNYVGVAEVSKGVGSSNSVSSSNSSVSSSGSVSSMRHANKRGRHENSDARREGSRGGGRGQHQQYHHHRSNANNNAPGGCTRFVLASMSSITPSSAKGSTNVVAGVVIFEDDSVGLLTSSVVREEEKKKDIANALDSTLIGDETRVFISKELLPPLWLSKSLGSVTCAITLADLGRDAGGKNTTNEASHPGRSRMQTQTTAVVTGHSDGMVMLWDESGVFVAQINAAEAKVGDAASIVCLASAGSRVLATADSVGNIVTWDLNEKQKLSTMRQQRGGLDVNNNMVINSRHRKKSLVSVKRDMEVEVKVCAKVCTLSVTSAVVVAGRSDGSVTVWQRSGQTLMHRADAHEDMNDYTNSSEQSSEKGGVICCSVPVVMPVFGVAAQAADVVFGTGGADSVACLWVLDTRMRASMNEGSRSRAIGVERRTPNSIPKVQGIGGVGRRLGRATHDDVIQEPIRVLLRKHTGAVRQMHIDPHKVVTSGDDGTIRIWSVNDELEGQLVRTLRWRGGRSPIVALAVDVGVIVGGALDGSLQAFVFGNWEDRRRQSIAADSLHEQLQRRQRVLLNAKARDEIEDDVRVVTSSPSLKKKWARGGVGARMMTTPIRNVERGANSRSANPSRSVVWGEEQQRLSASASSSNSARSNARKLSEKLSYTQQQQQQQKQQRRATVRGEGRSMRVKKTKRNGGGAGSGKGGAAWCNASKDTIRDLMHDNRDVDQYVARELGFGGVGGGRGGGSLYQ